MKRVIIIGAGLLGCFSARALSEYDLDITVLERGGDVCTGISKAGTGIVYTGYDNEPHTLKAELCINANRRFGELCEMLGVRYRKCGSLMVSFGPRGDARLRDKLDHGRIGGISGLRIIDRSEALELEPCLDRGVSTALYSEETGTVNPWELCIAAFECAAGNGVKFSFNEKVTGLSRDRGVSGEDRRGGFAVETDSASYHADVVINCAGLFSAQLRELCEKPYIRIFPDAADYLVTDTAAGAFISHIIFHEPEEKGKGLTVVPTVGGNLLIGPTKRSLGVSLAAFPDAAQPGSCGNPTCERDLKRLRELCGTVVPGLPVDRIIRSYSCLRPNGCYVSERNGQIIKEQKSISELKLLDEDGLYSFIGVKTPGMTFAAELGSLVTAKVTEYLGGVEKRSDFDPCRTPIPRPGLMEDGERSRFVSSNPDYGRIICRCEGISEGEIREAVRRGAHDFEGVKRRTGSGMGRCQGSYCRQQILKLLEEMDR